MRARRAASRERPPNRLRAAAYRRVVRTMVCRRCAQCAAELYERNTPREIMRGKHIQVQTQQLLPRSEVAVPPPRSRQDKRTLSACRRRARYVGSAREVVMLAGPHNQPRRFSRLRQDVSPESAAMLCANGGRGEAAFVGMRGRHVSSTRATNYAE